MLRTAQCLGPTFSLDGPSTGELAMVIRLSERPSARALEVDLLVRWVTGTSARLVVVTGDEPLHQPAALLALTNRLVELGYRVEVTTAATVVPPAELLAAGPCFLVSPSLPARNTAALAGFAGCDRSMFWVAAPTPNHIAELVALEQDHGLHPIWLAPPITPWLADQAITHGWNLSSSRHPATYPGLP